MTADQQGRQGILVLGMHRSGTSATTRVLNLLGAKLNSKLLEASLDNRKGFWESEDAVSIHERLLSALSRTWYDMQSLPSGWMSDPAAREAVDQIVELVRRDFEETSLWAIKDPRMCLLAPLWLEALARLNVEAKALIVVRNPAEVSESLRVRNEREHNQWGLGHSPLMWAQYLVEAEVATRDCSRTMLVYDDLLSDWRGVMTRIADDLGIVWPHDFSSVGAEIDAFLDRGERHHHVSLDAVGAAESGQPSLVFRMYEECTLISHGGRKWDVLATLANEFHGASDLYSAAIKNVWSHYEKAHARAIQAEESVSRIETDGALRDNELDEYRIQAKTYDRLLREANAQIESLSEAHERLIELTTQRDRALDEELEAYRKQASKYDDLLREANARADGLAKDLVMQSEQYVASYDAYQQEVGAYKQQSDKYDDLLREANARADGLAEELERQSEQYAKSYDAHQQEVGAYQQQAVKYDDLLREANALASGLDQELVKQSEQYSALYDVYQQEIAAYQQQADKYDDLLREANSRADGLAEDLVRHSEEAATSGAEYQKEIAMYRRQADKYDKMLREANAKIDSLSEAHRLLIESTIKSNHALDEELQAYHEQACTYDDLLREANERADRLAGNLVRNSEEASALHAAYREELAAYQEQAKKYDQLLREANERVEALGQLERVQVERLSAANYRLSELEQGKTLLQGQVERLRQSILEVESKNAALKQDNRRLSDALQRSNAQMEKLKAMSSEARADLDALEHRFQNLHEQREADLDALERQHRNLNEQREAELGSIRFLGKRLAKVIRLRLLNRRS